MPKKSTIFLGIRKLETIACKTESFAAPKIENFRLFQELKIFRPQNQKFCEHAKNSQILRIWSAKLCFAASQSKIVKASW